jgi:hypothetical protein
VRNISGVAVAEEEEVIGRRCWDQPAVQADGVTAGKPNILKWEIQVNWRLFYGSVGKKDLAFDEPIPATAKKTQE